MAKGQSEVDALILAAYAALNVSFMGYKHVDLDAKKVAFLEAV